MIVMMMILLQMKWERAWMEAEPAWPSGLFVWRSKIGNGDKQQSIILNGFLIK